MALDRRRPGTSKTALERVLAWWPAVVIALSTAAAFGIRLSQMRQGLFGDELTTYQDVVGRSLGAVLRTVNVGAENSPPLFFALAWLASKLGDPTVWVRLPSLILSTATIPLVYLIGREVAGRAVGLIGAAVLAASPFSMYYGIEARPYATMAFFVALSTLALIRAVRTGSAWWWVAYTLAAAAAAYTHYTSIFVLVTQVLWSLWACRNYLGKPVVAAGMIAVLYLPWLPNLRGKILGVIAGLHPLTLPNVLTDLLRPIAGHPYAPLSTIPTLPGLAVVGACALGGLLASVRRRRERIFGDPALRYERFLIAPLAVATPVGLLLYSLLGTDLWLPRGLYASVPSAALLFGAILTGLPRRLMGIAVSASILVLIAGTLVANGPRWSRPPYRQIAARLDQVAGPTEPIIAYPSPVGQGVPPYFRRAHTVLTPSPAAWRSVPPGGRVYVLIYDPGAYGLNTTVPNPAGFDLIARARYPGIAPTDLFTYMKQYG